jgi:3-hydroxyisobutyrate dehydrogenase
MKNKQSVGWIGAGRMGYEMAGLLAKGGADVLVWNRTKEKAKPLEKYGAKVADGIAELAARDIVFCMVSTYKDVKEVVTNMLAGRQEATHAH